LAGVAWRLAADLAATFVFAAFVFESFVFEGLVFAGFVRVCFGIARLDALAFFALRFGVLRAAVFREVVFRFGEFFAMLRILQRNSIALQAEREANTTYAGATLRGDRRPGPPRHGDNAAALPPA